MDKKVAIVILNWNGEKMLKEYLPSVIQYSRDEATVYVADNASADGSLALLRQHFPEVKLIVLDKNWGFAEGYNKALQQIEAEYYLLLNSDIEVTHHWLTPMIEYLTAIPMWQPASLNCYPSSTATISNMLGRVGDSLTGTATPSVVDVSSRRWRQIMASMTISRTASGRQVLR